MTAEAPPQFPRWEFTENISARIETMSDEIKFRTPRRGSLTRGVLAINEMDRFLQEPLDDEARYHFLIYFILQWPGSELNAGTLANRFNITPQAAIAIRDEFLYPQDADFKDARDIFLTLALNSSQRPDRRLFSFFSKTALLMRRHGPNVDLISRGLSTDIKGNHQDRTHFEIDLAISHNIIEALSRGTVEQKYERLKNIGLPGDQIYRRLGMLELERMPQTGDDLDNLLIIARGLRFKRARIKSDLRITDHPLDDRMSRLLRHKQTETVNDIKQMEARKIVEGLVALIEPFVRAGMGTDQIMEETGHSHWYVELAIAEIGKKGVDVRSRKGRRPESARLLYKINTLKPEDDEAEQACLDQVEIFFYRFHRTLFCTPSEIARALGLKYTRYAQAYDKVLERAGIRSKKLPIVNKKGESFLTIFFAFRRNDVIEAFQSAPELQKFRKK